jgi:hypothetical protein
MYGGIFRSFFDEVDGEVFNKDQSNLTKLMQYPPTNLKHLLIKSRRPNELILDPVGGTAALSVDSYHFVEVALSD